MAQELGAMHIGLSIYMGLERSLISFMMGAMDQWEIESQESDMWCLLLIVGTQTKFIKCVEVFKFYWFGCKFYNTCEFPNLGYTFSDKT